MQVSFISLLPLKSLTSTTTLQPPTVLLIVLYRLVYDITFYHEEFEQVTIIEVAIIPVSLRLGLIT